MSNIDELNGMLSDLYSAFDSFLSNTIKVLSEIQTVFLSTMLGGMLPGGQWFAVD